MYKASHKVFQIASILILLSLILSACSTPTQAPPPQPADTQAPAAAPTTVAATQPAVATQPAATGSFKLAQRIADKVAKGEKLVIRVSYHDVSNEFAPQIKAGVEKAAKEFGYDAVMVGPVGAKAEDQIAELESLIEKGVDGLAISSVSTDALAPVINKALEAGIPVVTFNTDNPSSNRLAFVGQDLVGSGRIAGDLIAKQMNGKGQVLITTLDAAAQWSLDREKGAREALSKYPDIKVLATINTGTEPQAIYTAIENAMLANQTATGILSMECCSVSPAGEYVKRNDLKGKVTVVGFDFLPSTLQLLKDGYIQATIGQGPEKQGYEAVHLVGEALKGNAVTSIDTGAEVVDATNIAKYLK
jgi:simple sugar transport system substrate-binding protein